MAIRRRSFARDIVTVGTATLCSRLLGFARDLGVAIVLGAGLQSDAFFAAMLVPNLFRRLLAEGALNSAFVPAWLRVRDSGGRTTSLTEEALGTVLLTLGLLGLACSLLAPFVVHAVAPGFAAADPRFGLAISYLRIAIPYIAIAGIVAVAAAELNAQGRVAAVSIGVVIYNGIAVAAVAFVAFGPAIVEPGILLSAAVVVAGLAQLAVIGTALLRLPDPPHHLQLARSPETLRFFRTALPGLIAAGIPQLKLIAGAMVASSSQSAVSWLYYTYRLYELPLGVISVAIASVMAPLIAASVRADAQATRAAQSRALEIAIGLALPAAVGLAILATPIAATLFEHGAFTARDTAAVGAAISAIAAGLPGHAIEKVFGSMFFAREDTRTPMLAALAGLAVAILAAITLFPIYGHVGIAIAIAGSGWIGAAILGALLLRQRWLVLDAVLAWRLPRIIAIALLMGVTVAVAASFAAATFVGQHGFPARVMTLAALLGLGLMVYVGGLAVLGIVNGKDLIATVRQGSSPDSP
jgi:putative peptidoglycan lipid II flippase